MILDSTILFEGVVEDIDDPVGLNRVRVRFLYIHTSDKSQIPTEDLPWAQVMHPITSAAMNGIGQTPGLLPGSHVIGFFRDGNMKQDPVILGSIGGIPQALSNTSQGFSDPNGEYPSSEYIDEPDTSRLARGENLSKTYIKERNELNATGIETANGTQWNIPKSPFNATYPYNKVNETRSGIIVEHDDTPGAVRIMERHPSGTFREIDNNGTVVQRIVGDGYTIYERHGHVVIHGNADVTVDGSKSLYIKNAMNVRIDGDCTATFMNDVNMTAIGDYTMNVKGDYNLNVEGNSTLRSNGDMTQTSGGRLGIGAGTRMQLSSQGTFDADGMLMHIGYGRANVPHESVSVAGERANPTEPDLPPLPSNSLAESMYMDHDEPENPPTQQYLESFDAVGLPRPDVGGSLPGDVPDEKDDNTPSEVKQGNPVTCAAFSGMQRIPDTTRLSTNYLLRDVSTSTAVSHYRVRAQVGLTIPQIVCNLKATCENVAERVKAQFPDMYITSGFRVGSGRSQHNRGQAIDMQFSNASDRDYFDIAVWIRDNIPHDQLLLENTSSSNHCWIHCSFNAQGNRGQYFSMYNHKRVSKINEFIQVA